MSLPKHSYEPYNRIRRIFKKLRKKLKKIGWDCSKIIAQSTNVDYVLQAHYKNYELVVDYDFIEDKSFYIHLSYITPEYNEVVPKDFNRRYKEVCPKRFDRRYRKRLLKYIELLTERD